MGNEVNREMSRMNLELIGAIDRFSSGNVLIIGDCMLDAYLMGDAERISPEAPVPVVRIDSEKHLLGGAGNVARNIASLGGKATLVGVRGEDVPGRELEAALEQQSVEFAFVVTPERPTTVKTRLFARQQQVVRFDREDSSPLSNEENTSLYANMEQLIKTADAVILSDYGKGVISQELVRTVCALAQNAQERKGIPVLVDPKPQNMGFYKGVTLLTPNAKETSESVNMPVRTPEEILLAGQAIMNELECRHLVTTLGAQGMAVFESDSVVWHIPTVARQVFDVTGAGDTVIATLALALASRSDLLLSCLLANYAAGIVVGEVGAGMVLPNQLAEAVATLPRPELSRWK